APPPDSHSVWENGGVVWARASKALYAGSIPASASRAVSSAGERFPDTEEVTGSNPVSPTRSSRSEAGFRTPETGLKIICHPFVTRTCRAQVTQIDPSRDSPTWLCGTRQGRPRRDVWG